MGYDGKGQAKIGHVDDVPAAFAALKSDALIAEGFVRFRRALSVVLARGPDGSIVSWGPVANIHRNHILWRTHAPARLEPALAAHTRAIARPLAEGPDSCGLMAGRLFDCRDP